MQVELQSARLEEEIEVPEEEHAAPLVEFDLQFKVATFLVQAIEHNFVLRAAFVLTRHLGLVHCREKICTSNGDRNGAVGHLPGREVVSVEDEFAVRRVDLDHADGYLHLDFHAALARDAKSLVSVGPVVSPSQSVLLEDVIVLVVRVLGFPSFGRAIHHVLTDAESWVFRGGRWRFTGSRSVLSLLAACFLRLCVRLILNSRMLLFTFILLGAHNEIDSLQNIF